MSRTRVIVTGKTSRVLVKGRLPVFLGKTKPWANIDLDLVLKVSYAGVEVRDAKALESAIEEGLQLELATWYRTKVKGPDQLQVEREGVGADDTPVGARVERSVREEQEDSWLPDDLGPAWEDSESPSPPEEG